MSVQFAVLASGSRGNAALVRSSGTGLLIDAGLGPRTLGRRLATIGASLDGVATVLLTHTHGDHVRESTLYALARRGIGLLCHDAHRERLRHRGGFQALEARGLVRTYDDRPFFAPGGARVEAIALSHDSGPTFGFRIECKDRPRGRPVAIGIATDTGDWWGAIADALAESDVLGLEFNHDVERQLASGRSPSLIARNLGRHGHLSNAQGAELLAAVLDRSRPGSVRHVVLMHLSEECNRVALALGEARDAVRRCRRRLAIHAAQQDLVTPILTLEPARVVRRAPVAAFPWEAA
jgi:phosphoribosyl 1,2-cyclic phosphodiesterase